MTLFDENVGILRKQRENIEGVPAITGRLQTNGTYANAADTNPNKIWVTREGRAAQLVWNNGRFVVNTRFSGVPVRISQTAEGGKEWEVCAGDAQYADIAFGANAGTALSPQIDLELSGSLAAVANLKDLKPYKDTEAALTIRALPGWLPNGTRWPDSDGYDMTADITATSGQSAYVVVGIDLSDNTWTAETTVDRASLVFPPYPAYAADIETVIQDAAWSTVFPIAAVPLTNGATSFANADIIDLRELGGGGDSAGGIEVAYSDDDVNNPPTQEELAAAFGEPADLGRRFLGILDDAGAGTKEYAIFCDGAQFLGVPLVAFRSELATDTWVRQGAILEPLGGSETLLAEPCFIYEGSPQILTDLPRVFKCWFRGGTGSTAAGYAIYYAESPTGLPGTWTRYPSALVTECFSPHVVHDGSTYYLFVAGGLYVRIDLYTSSDGINFTLHGTVLNNGSAATWDDDSLANPFVWKEGADWKMLYEGRDTGNVWMIGYATSSDGLSWTKSGSNPVLSSTGMRGGPLVYKSGSTYYVYGQGATSGDLPTDIYRSESANLTAWSNETLFLERDGTDEGEGTGVGQVADPGLLIVNGVAYFFYAATPDGSDDDGTIKLMTGAPALLTA